MSTAPTSSGSMDPRLDLYIDGLLAGEDLAAFERDLAASPSLQRALQLQKQIDAGLRDLYVYDPARATEPKPPAVIGRVDGSAAPAKPSWLAGRSRWYVLAAALLLAATVLSVYVQNQLTPERVIGPATVYAMVDQPEFVCTTDAEFAAAVRKRLGQPLILAAAPGIEALGWAYGDDYNGQIVGKKTMVLINRVRGEKVLVFMDKLSADRPLEVQPSSGLKLFRQEIGSLVVYEVSPLSQPEVITRLRIPEANR